MISGRAFKIRFSLETGFEKPDFEKKILRLVRFMEKRLMDEDLVTLAVFDTEREATLLKMLLADKGIIAALADNNLSNAHGLISLAIGGVKVLVPKAHEKLARAVLEKAHAENRCAASAADPADKSPVEAYCEDCGKTAKYPCAMRGKVAKCLHCGAFIDVPD